jgi:hypothetical protein
MISEKHIKNFIEKGKKFLSRHISYSKCHMGTPSIVKITNPTTSTHTCYKVSTSSERHYLSSTITLILEDNLFLPKEECKQIADYIVQKKYEQYTEFVMSS